jgi:hypothetical protein
MSVEDYALLRQNRKVAMTTEEMPLELVEVIASARMDAEHDHLNALMDE